MSFVALIAAVPVACSSPTTGPGGLPPGGGAVLFSDDFESASLAAWEDGFDAERHRIQTDSSAGNRYLATTYPAGRDGGWLTRFIRPGGDSLYVSLDVRFPNDWIGGTKLVGFYGSRNDDQWSAFGKAGLCPTGSDFFAAMVVTEAGGDPGPARFYTYYPAMSREPDGRTCWGRYGDGSERYTPPLTLSRGVWHRLEFFVQLNTPGRADGRQMFWIDGAQRGSWSGISFRDGVVLELNAVQLSFSVSGGVPRTQQLHVDNIVVRSAPA